MDSTVSRKRCSKCQQEKPVGDFRRDATKTSGYKSQCKACLGKAPATIGEVIAAAADRFDEKPIYRASIEAQRELAKGPNLAAFDAENEQVYVGSLGEVTRLRDNIEKLTPVEEHRLKRKLRELEAANKGLVDDLSNAQLFNDIVRDAQNTVVPGIMPRETTSGLREGTALVMASDWHIDEVIEPGQVNGRNRYNPEISARRMERFFESILWAINSQRNTFKIRDLVMWLGGDLITNFLHEDNVLTNAMSPPEALAYAQASISDGIRFLLTDPELERIVIPCNDGNHGRMSKRMGSSSRTMMSLEIMLYRMLKREFQNEPRVQFIIAEGEHLYYEVYGRTIRFAHGDSIKYSGGIGGVTIPIMKALASWNTIRNADLTCIGHFHQRLVLPDLMVNSSLIGYGPFSLTIRARFEPPSQNFSIIEPKRFRSLDMPLWVSERADDNDFYG